MPEDGIVFDLQRFSLHDGPGIRTVIFFKGCPLCCQWCQNPEGLEPRPEISFSKEKCLGCHECQKVCPVRAIVFEGTKRIDRQVCDRCGKCVEVCYAEALRIVGKSYTPAELLEEAMSDMPFFVSSGGGITLSGGEPTCQADFLTSFLPLCKEKELHIALETCGCFVYEELEPLLSCVDLILYDIKAIDPVLHQKLTGRSNKTILENLGKLLKKDECAVQVRVPLIPTLTATDENLKAILVFLKEHNITEVSLLPYHKMGESKLEGIDSPLRPLNLARMSEQDLMSISALFRNAGIEALTY